MKKKKILKSWRCQLGGPPPHQVSGQERAFSPKSSLPGGRYEGRSWVCVPRRTVKGFSSRKPSDTGHKGPRARRHPLVGRSTAGDAQLDKGPDSRCERPGNTIDSRCEWPGNTIDRMISYSSPFFFFFFFFFKVFLKTLFFWSVV